jgi:hypothetical protein
MVRQLEALTLPLPDYFQGSDRCSLHDARGRKRCDITVPQAKPTTNSFVALFRRFVMACQAQLRGRANLSAAQMQGRNIRNYSNYLNERARTYGDVRTDYVRGGEGRLRKLSVEKGLLREVECVQTQIKALLKCQVSHTFTDSTDQMSPLNRSLIGGP